MPDVDFLKIVIRQNSCDLMDIAQHGTICRLVEIDDESIKSNSLLFLLMISCKIC